MPWCIVRGRVSADVRLEKSSSEFSNEGILVEELRPADELSETLDI
jgi:hypothetical protein